MKVILLKDVAKVGRRFEVVDVPDGFALNKLIPKNFAQFATPENIKRIEATAMKQKEHQVHDAEVFTAVLAKLANTTVAIPVDSNTEGRLFQALKPEAVVFALNELLGRDTINKDQVVIHEPIKTLGAHSIELASGKNHGVITIILSANVK
jgi:large subunit ribosomal protein L9